MLALLAIVVVVGATSGPTRTTFPMSSRRPIFSTTTKNHYDADGVTLYYAHTMNETICYMLRSSNVTAKPDVVEIILNVLSRNLQSTTVSKVMKALDGEVNPAQRANYLKDAVPRIVGLYRKMNMLVYGLADIYGFTGETAKIYAKLIRPMQLSAIISAALDGAQNESNSEQYEKVLALARDIMNMDNYFNKTITKLLGK